MKKFMTLQKIVIDHMVDHESARIFIGRPKTSRLSLVMIWPKDNKGQKSVLILTGCMAPNATQSHKRSRQPPMGTLGPCGTSSRMTHENVSPFETPPNGTVAKKRRPSISASK